MPWVALEPTTLAEREELLRRWTTTGPTAGSIPTDVPERPRRRGAGLMRRIAANGLEIGYWVHPASRERVCDSCGASADDHRVEPSGVSHIEIHHDKANVASGRVPLKLGFEMVGDKRVKPAAPGESGLSCVWRVGRSSWAASDTESAPGLPAATETESTRFSRHD